MCAQDLSNPLDRLIAELEQDEQATAEPGAPIIVEVPEEGEASQMVPASGDTDLVVGDRNHHFTTTPLSDAQVPSAEAWQQLSTLNDGVHWFPMSPAHIAEVYSVADGLPPAQLPVLCERVRKALSAMALHTPHSVRSAAQLRQNGNANWYRTDLMRDVWTKHVYKSIKAVGAAGQTALTPMHGSTGPPSTDVAVYRPEGVAHAPFVRQQPQWFRPTASFISTNRWTCPSCTCPDNVEYVCNWCGAPGLVGYSQHYRAPIMQQQPCPTPASLAQQYSQYGLIHPWHAPLSHHTAVASLNDFSAIDRETYPSFADWQTQPQFAPLHAVGAPPSMEQRVVPFLAPPTAPLRRASPMVPVAARVQQQQHRVTPAPRACRPAPATTRVRGLQSSYRGWSRPEVEQQISDLLKMLHSSDE